jgi:hypothetical protein
MEINLLNRANNTDFWWVGGVVEEKFYFGRVEGKKVNTWIYRSIRI